MLDLQMLVGVRRSEVRMNTAVGRIVWPADPEAAGRHYLGFAIQVVERLGISFPTSLPDPIATARAYVADQLAAAELRAQRDAWWDYIDTVGGVREFLRREALIARLALCLFPLPEQAPELSEKVSWLFVMLEELGCEETFAERLRLTYFEYR